MRRTLGFAVVVCVAVATWWLVRSGDIPARPVDGASSSVDVWASSGALADVAGRLLGDPHRVRRVTFVYGLPARDELAAMQSARAVIGLGPTAGDGWMALVGLPAAARIELAEGVWGDGLVARAGAVSHRHGPEGAHTHVEREPAPWVEPRRARELLGLVEVELARRGLAPNAAGEDARALAAELERLAARLDALSPVDLLATDGAYRYLASRPGWSVEVAALDSTVPASETALGFLDAARGRAPSARVLLVPASPHPSWAPALAARGLEAAVVPTDGDGRYFEALALALQALADRLAAR